jgi:2-oxoglutarate ferredoxin oxidoreductase subunit alpha
LARPWAIPGTPDLEHRLGGLEKDYLTGNVSYSPENHERMTLVREDKIKGIASDIPPVDVDGPDADILVLGWGSSYGAITAGVRRVRARGEKVAQAHLRHLNPFPANLADVLAQYDKILIPELNRGQLWRLLRAEFLVDAISYPKVQGQPFKAVEIETKIMELLGS